jgi:AP-3 complex subunit beta
VPNLFQIVPPNVYLRFLFYLKVDTVCLSIFNVVFLYLTRADVVVSNTILVLRSFIQNKSHSTAASSATSVISRFAYRIENIRHPQAKACALWLVGQYSPDPNLESVGGPDGVANWAPDVLRKCAKSFGNEVSCQISRHI